MRASFPELVSALRSVLGARLVAYLGSVKETRAVRQWAEGEREPSEEVRNRLRVALQVALPLAETESPEIAQACCLSRSRRRVRPPSSRSHG